MYFSEWHRLFSNSKANHLFLVKDELCGKSMTRFIGLRSKQYAYEIGANKSDIKKVCKGIKKATIKKHLTFEHYKNALFKEKAAYLSAFLIRSRKHQLTTDYVMKLATSSFDDKRWVHPTKFTTTALFNYRNK